MQSLNHPQQFKQRPASQESKRRLENKMHTVIKTRNINKTNDKKVIHLNNQKYTSPESKKD